MLPFHERIAQTALRIADKYGFALAGGYALSVNGIGTRPSMDVDLFTNITSPEHFRQAVDEVCTALEQAGLIVTPIKVNGTFADIKISDPSTGESSPMQLGMNYRDYPPVQIDIGPALDTRDAVAGKMSALWSRAEVRDFIDIYNVVQSGAMTREQVLEIGDAQEAEPFDREVLVNQLQSIADRASSDWQRYLIEEPEKSAIINWYTQWADDLSHERETGITSDLNLAEPTYMPADLLGQYAIIRTKLAPDRATGAVVVQVVEVHPDFIKVEILGNGSIQQISEADILELRGIEIPPPDVANLIIYDGGREEQIKSDSPAPKLDPRFSPPPPSLWRRETPGMDF